eukprot:maker-scaffold_8-snap-gene-5.9-mRNA-1 protein AED:0.02 eAED:0.02 QI:88/0.66/0.75/1/0/0/4/178/372
METKPLLPTNMNSIPFIDEYKVLEIEKKLAENLPFKFTTSNKKYLSWTLQTLLKKSGHNEVIVRTDVHKKEYKDGTRVPIHKMPLSQYIDQVSTNKAKKFYLAACNIKKALPELVSEVTLPTFIKKVHKGPTRPFLWIAPQRHYEFCHFDPDDGLLIVVKGRKNVRICSPEYLHELYPNPLGSFGRTVQSQVLFDQETSKFSRFNQVQLWETTLTDGEALYIPAFWWHQVISEYLTVSLNVFWGSDLFVKKIQKEPVLKTFEYWMINVLEQNRRCSNFLLILSNLEAQIERFLYNQWAEKIPKEFIQHLANLCLDHVVKTISTEDKFFSVEEVKIIQQTSSLSSFLLEKDKKHSQRLRIRGLMHRTGKGHLT